jgi:hypothetical protein
MLPRLIRKTSACFVIGRSCSRSIIALRSATPPKETRRAINGLVREAKDMNEACDDLVKAGWIRLLPTKGRTRIYEVNPLARL